jgi:translocation and assembly module TamB
VPEVTGARQASNVLSSEVLESNIPLTRIGGLQTVRIQAHTRGLASQLFEGLELTSSPARSRAEIISLLGGGFVATLGRGDNTLGIANLAGSALLTNVQTKIGQAPGLSEFRLFPALVRDKKDQEAEGDTTLGLAGEAAVDLTPRISASVLKVLTNNQPAQFGLRYRLNQNTLLRGSTDFNGDSRAAIEFELRF